MKISNLNCEHARIVEMDVTHQGKVVAWMHMHHSLNAGMYGYQIAIRFGDHRLEDDYQEYKTSDCGYCKATDAFEYFVSSILGERSSLGGDVSYYLSGTKYHKGGNYYKVPLSVLKRIVKNRGIK